MEKILFYNKEASAFEEALPLGNGSLGAIIYGGTSKERITINHDTLWSGEPGQAMVETAFEANERAKKLVNEGKYYEAQRELENNFTGRWLNSYLYLGNLYLERLDFNGNISGYSRKLDLESSVASVSYTENGVDFSRECFVSYPDNCIVVKVKSSKPVSYKLYGDCIGKSSVTASENTLYMSGECPSHITPEYARFDSPILYDGNGVKVTGMVRVVCDGISESGVDHIIIKDTADLTLYFCAETSFVAFDKLPNKPTFYPCLERLEALSKKSFDELKKTHVNDVKPLFNKIETDFGGEESPLPTDERLKSDNKELGLCELLYNFGRYLIIASSRKGSRATNLQGIWNDKFYAPWSSNYTVNINTEMNYWPVLMCNLVDCHYPLLDLIENISKNGEETAKCFYHANGFVSHHNLDLWANTTPVGNKREGSARYAYWNMSSGWLSRHLFEHYEYTLDKKFLMETAYPIMKKAAEFYLSIMEYKNGKWLVTPSTSPENACMIDGKTVTVFPYTAMTQGILEDLFTNIVKSAEILGIDDDFIKEIKEKLEYVNVYEIGSKGQLLEYDKEYEEEDVHHRHVSHLYGLYPANLISTEKTPDLANACRQTLEIRGDESTGWSMGWKVNLWSKLKDGDRALKLVKTQLTFVQPQSELNYGGGGGTYANMFDAHPPFQIDGNFGVVAGISQMFLQSEDGKIKILPALPSEMKNGKIKGLLAKGGIKVDIEWENSKLSSLKLVTPYEQTAIINIEGADREIHLLPNQEFIAV